MYKVVLINKGLENNLVTLFNDVTVSRPPKTAIFVAVL